MENEENKSIAPSFFEAFNPELRLLRSRCFYRDAVSRSFLSERGKAWDKKFEALAYRMIRAVCHHPMAVGPAPCATRPQFPPLVSSTRYAAFKSLEF